MKGGNLPSLESMKSKRNKMENINNVLEPDHEYSVEEIKDDLYAKTHICREVIVEFVGTTTETVKKKIRFEEDVDFENPSEDLKDLLFKEFLSQSYQKMSMRILHDEDLSDYEFQKSLYTNREKEPTDDHLVYMKNSRIVDFTEGFSERYGLLPKLGRWSHLSCKEVKSVLTVGSVPIESRYREENPSHYFGDYDYDKDIWFFTKDKEEIRDMWENKKFKSIVESVPEGIRSARKTYHLSKYHKLFEKGISTKKQREEGGYFMCILNDVDDFRKFNCTPENSIVLGERLLD